MCFRSIALAIVMAAVLSALAGCGTDLKIRGGSATQEGVTVTLEKAAAQKKTNPSRYEYSFSGTGRTAVFTSGEQLDKALDLFCNIRIGEETGEMVTDNYNWISLTWKDGSKSSISLNLRNLEHYIHSEPHIFTLENLGDFWSFASDYLEEDK